MTSPVQASGPSLVQFMDAARHTAFKSSTLTVKGGEVQELTLLQNAFALKKTFREATQRFLDALKREFGDHFADLAGSELKGMLKSGQPLTACHVKYIVAEAERLRSAYGAFLTGVDDKGEAVPQNLHAAVDAWFAGHPCAPALSDAERAALEMEISQSLRRSRVAYHSPAELFEAVKAGRFSPLRQAAERLEHLLRTTASDEQLKAELRTALGDQADAAFGELARLKDEVRARLCEASGGCTRSDLDEAAATDIRKRAVADFAARWQQIATEARPEERAAAQARMFAPEGEVIRLLSEEKLSLVITDVRNRAANQALADAAIGPADADPARRPFNLALRQALDMAGLPASVIRCPGDGNPADGAQPLLLTPEMTAALETEARAAIARQAGEALPVTALDVTAVGAALSESLAAWANSLATASQAGDPGEARALLECLVSDPRRVGDSSAYLAELLAPGRIAAIPEAVRTGLAQADSVNTLLAGLDACSEWAAAATATLPEVATRTEDALRLGLSRAGTTSEAIQAMYARLHDDEGKALRALLDWQLRQDQVDPKAAGRLATLLALNRTLADALHIGAARAEAEWALVADRAREDLPPLAREWLDAADGHPPDPATEEESSDADSELLSV